MKSSFHSLIPFLPLLCKCQFQRFDSVQFLCSQAHIPAGWRLETHLTLLNWTLLHNNFARTTQETQPLYRWEGVFTASQHSNGSYSIVACVFVAAGMCLVSRCPAMNIYTDFTIPAFGHVSISFSDSTISLACCYGYRGHRLQTQIYVFHLYMNGYSNAAEFVESTMELVTCWAGTAPSPNL
jgi:hypothetical protein